MYRKGIVTIINRITIVIMITFHNDKPHAYISYTHTLFGHFEVEVLW